jgi:hypothetical protein
LRGRCHGQPTVTDHSLEEEQSTAELTNLESKLGEVLGLAMAAQGATTKVEGLLEGHGDLAERLQQMRREAEETERRCTEVADARDGKKTAILDKARETKQEAVEMMNTDLGDDADALDGFEFLTMAEAGEVGHWSIVGKLGEKAGDRDVLQLTEWALPIQQGHFEGVLHGSLELAAEEDPDEVA